MTTIADLRVSEITAVFTAMRDITRLALEGADEREIGLTLDMRLEDVRTAASLMGFSVSPMVLRQELCPKCNHVLMPDGSCEVCVRRLRLERLGRVNEEERRREVERLDNEIDATKQETHRIRVRLGTTPRGRSKE